MTTAKHWSSEAIEVVLAAQGVALAPKRAERIAAGLQSLLDASVADPLRATLEFDADPPAFMLALQRCKPQ